MINLNIVDFIYFHQIATRYAADPCLQSQRATPRAPRQNSQRVMPRTLPSEITTCYAAGTLPEFAAPHRELTLVDAYLSSPIRRHLVQNTPPLQGFQGVSNPAMGAFSA